MFTHPRQDATSPEAGTSAEPPRVRAPGQTYLWRRRKQHVCACGILTNLCELMCLMFLMFLNIAVLHHIFNILLRSIVVYVLKSCVSQNVFLRALRLQVLCVFICGSSLPFVALYCVWPNSGDRQQVAMVAKRKADEQGGTERSRPIHRVEGS